MSKKALKWTKEELDKLEEGVNIFGDKDWKKVSEYIGTRSYLSCKYQWVYVKFPEKSITPWTEEQDLKLQEWVKIRGKKSFRSAMKVIPGKTVYSIQKRYKEIKRRLKLKENSKKKIEELASSVKTKVESKQNIEEDIIQNKENIFNESSVTNITKECNAVITP